MVPWALITPATCVARSSSWPRTPPSQGGDRGFESRTRYQSLNLEKAPGVHRGPFNLGLVNINTDRFYLPDDLRPDLKLHASSGGLNDRGTRRLGGRTKLSPLPLVARRKPFIDTS